MNRDNDIKRRYIHLKSCHSAKIPHVHSTSENRFIEEPNSVPSKSSLAGSNIKGAIW